jgi:hypothetical protein
MPLILQANDSDRLVGMPATLRQKWNPRNGPRYVVATLALTLVLALASLISVAIHSVVRASSGSEWQLESPLASGGGEMTTVQCGAGGECVVGSAVQAFVSYDDGATWRSMWSTSGSNGVRLLGAACTRVACIAAGSNGTLALAPSSGGRVMRFSFGLGLDPV